MQGPLSVSYLAVPDWGLILSTHSPSVLLSALQDIWPVNSDGISISG